MPNISISLRRACYLLGLCVILSVPAGAQTSPDSVATWSAALSSGSLQERATAAANLAQVSPLPASGQRAVLNELERLNAQRRIAGTRWADDVWEYWMALVQSAAGIPTDEARVALVPALSVSPGVARRVARGGDVVVPLIIERLVDRHDADRALVTLGYAWYWADSTGSPLTDASRGRILNTWIAAAGDTAFELRLGLSDALDAAGDATLLPLAELLQRQTAGQPGPDVLGGDIAHAVSHLRALVGKMSTGDLVARTERTYRLLCMDAPVARRRGYCNQLVNDFREVARHIERGQVEPARNGLASLQKSADRVFADGVLATVEHGLVVGNLALVTSRLP